MAHYSLRTVPARPRSLRNVAVIVLLAALLPAGIRPSAHGETPPVPEYAVKAAFLYNFTKFVEWPADSFSGPASPIVICVFGEDPFGDALVSLKGKTANGRPIAIRNAETPGELDGCHLLFVGSPDKASLRRILHATKGRSLLTVGDTNDFAREGGIINMVNREGRIGIEINLEAARHARLKISSKLLALAKIVQQGRRQGE